MTLQEALEFFAWSHDESYANNMRLREEAWGVIVEHKAALSARAEIIRAKQPLAVTDVQCYRGGGTLWAVYVEFSDGNTRADYMSEPEAKALFNAYLARSKP